MSARVCALGARWVALTFLVLVAACGKGGDDEAGELDCPTTTPSAPQAATTTTVDPRCVQRATEAGEETAGPAGDWRGTFAGTVTWDCGPIGERTGRLTGEFKITTPEDARALMDGTNTVTGSCAGPTEGTLTTPISVEGKVTEDGFEFPGDLWGPPSAFTIKVTDDRGSGVLEGPAPGPARVNLVYEIER